MSENSDQTETLICVEIPEKPGAFMELYNTVAPRNVTEFSYRYQEGQRASIIMSFQARGNEDTAAVLEGLNELS